VNSGQDFAERALPRAVFATQCMTGTGRDLERHVVEGARAGKPFRDVLETDRGNRHGSFK